MDRNHFDPGVQRRRIEDQIIARFREVDFSQKYHAYLEDETFWDYIFAWYDLVKYYDEGQDTAIGQNMLQLYAESLSLFQSAITDSRLRERRRDRAANAIYQINYYLNQIVIHAERNAQDNDDSIGRIY